MLNTLVLTASIALVVCSVASATRETAEPSPFLKKQDLFDGQRFGFRLYRIPGLVITKSGTILAYCEARKNAPADYGEIETHLRRSTDGGETWDRARQIAHSGPRIEGNPAKPADSGDKEQTVNDPVAIADRNGAVHFLYCVNYEHAFYMRSDDDGKTFGKPVDITSAFESFRSKYDWQVIATGPTHGIQLKSGRLLVPVWFAFGGRGKHGPSAVGTIYSDDHGATWKGGDVAIPNEGPFKSPNESVLVELADGRVMINTRSPSDPNRRLISISPDGISNWSTPRFDPELWEPICAAGLTSLPDTPHTLIYSAPRSLKLDDNDQPVPAGQGPRRNLTIYLSEDDGNTWKARRTLEEGASAYSDLAVTADGTILCFYERDQRLTLARFNKAWILAKPED